MNSDFQPPLFKPDFVQIPYQLIDDRTLDSMDRLLYGLVYWYEHMKDGECWASNQTLAALLYTTTRVVQNSLTRLENKGYIEREYKDKAKRNRTKIRALIAYKRVSLVGDRRKTSDPQVTRERPTDDRHERPIDDHIEIKSIETKKEKIDTPGEFARKFFNGDKDIVGSIGKQLEDAGLPQPFIVAEMLKFKNYWTEPTKNGKKVRWELQQTFDVRRRLGTWFRNAAERSNGTRRSGAGVSL